MKRNTVLFFIVLTIIVSACSTSHKKEVVFQQILNSTLQKHPDAIGVLVHVENPDQSISWSGAIGSANWEKTETIEADQPALIASITKNFVAVSILRLVEQGRLQLFQPIEELLSEKTAILMRNSGFNTKLIHVAHLLSHKSGIPDYWQSASFIKTIEQNPAYRWTRDEQINLALREGPINLPGTSFYYADSNYLILTEIIEQATGVPYYSSIASLVGYKKLGLTNTWFYSLETAPKNGKKLIHQYMPSAQTDSRSLDYSADLYGGGGLASTTADLGKYACKLFQGNVFDDQKTLTLLFTQVATSDADSSKQNTSTMPCDYLLGIQKCSFNGLNSYWHNGFWGTTFRYFPELKTSVVIFVVNESAFANVENELLTQITDALK